MNADSNAFTAALSTGLVAVPWWSEIVQAYSTMVQCLSVTVGAVIGVITLYRMLVTNKRVRR